MRKATIPYNLGENVEQKRIQKIITKVMKITICHIRLEVAGEVNSEILTLENVRLCQLTFTQIIFLLHKIIDQTKKKHPHNIKSMTNEKLLHCRTIVEL